MTEPARSPRCLGSADRTAGRTGAVAAMVMAVIVAAGACTPAETASGPAVATTAAGGTVTTPATAATDGSPATEGTPAPDRDRPLPTLTWSECRNGLECATLAVPLDRRDPGSATIDLDVLRRPAVDPATSRGPILVNPGGPGGSARSMAATLARSLPTDFDVYGLDPRGIGGSIPLTCDGDAEARFRATDSDPDDAGEQSMLEVAAAEVTAACERTSATLLGHMTTDDAADDVDLLRQAIGADQITWIGFSYGTAIGLRYAERFGTHLRAMVLDGVVDPELTLADLLIGQARSLRAAIDRAMATCRQDGSCRTDPGPALEQLREQVEVQPLEADNGPVGPAELALATVAAGYSRRSMQDFLAAVADPASPTRADELRRLSDRYIGGAGFGTYLGVECTDGPRPTDVDGFRALAAATELEVPGLGAAVINELLPCATWPAGPGPAHSRPAARDAPPILVIGTTGDASTPYASAEFVAASLRRATLLTHDGEGHTATFQSPCVADAVRRYVVGLILPPEGTRCP